MVFELKFEGSEEALRWMLMKGIEAEKGLWGQGAEARSQWPCIHITAISDLVLYDRKPLTY